MKKVLVKIKGTQGLDGDNTVIELATEGTFRKLDGDYIITYNEDQTIQDKTTKTVLTARCDNTVILERRGELNSRLVITEGVRNNCLYAIPQGSLTLGIYGKTVTNNLSDNGGKLTMVYTVDANLQPLSENTVEITVEER